MNTVNTASIKFVGVTVNTVSLRYVMGTENTQMHRRRNRGASRGQVPQ